MTSTSFVPLKALQSYYDDTTAYVNVHLYLLGTTGAVLDGDAVISDVDGALATTGSYNATTGIDAGEWPLNYDTDAAAMELSVPDGAWTSTSTYSLTYQWIVVTLPGGFIATAVNLGTAQTLAAATLAVYANESTYIANSFPVLRWRKA